MTHEEFIELITDLVAKYDKNRIQRSELEREVREGKRDISIAYEMFDLCQSGLNNACKVVDVCRKYLQENKQLT